MKKPSLRAEFEKYEQEHPVGRGPQCRTCLLPPDLRATIEALIKAGKPKATIAGFLKMKGHQISAYSVRHHEKNHGA